jgi:hypothetical protein
VLGEELWRVHEADDLRGDCDDFRKYLKLIGSFLADERERFEQNNSGHSGDELSVDRWRLRGTFPTILINGSLINIYSYGEIKIRQLCLLDANLRGLARGTKGQRALDAELRKNDGVKEYWTRCKLGYANTPEWAEIMDVRDIRNHLVHVGEYIDATDRFKRIEDYVNRRVKRGLVTLNVVWGQIDVHAEYCEELIGLFHRFLTMQLKAMPSYRLDLP